MELLQCSVVKQNRNLQKRVLRFLLNAYDSTYEGLLEKPGYPNMNLRKQSMNDIFKLRNTETWKFQNPIKPLL